MTNRVDYQRLKKGDSKKCLAIVASRAALADRERRKPKAAKKG